MTADLYPLLALLLFVPTFGGGAICAALVAGAVRFRRLDRSRAQVLVATGWWVLLSAALWIGCDRLMAAGKADNAAPFAAILVWLGVVVPGPILGGWLLRLRDAPGAS